MRTLTKTLLFTSLLAMGGLAVAGPHGPGGHGPRGPGHAFLQAVRDLDLTEEQRTGIRAILEAAREDRKEGHEERRAEMQAFKAELLSDAPDAKKLHRMADERHAERQARMHERLDDMIAVSQLLTPAQRAEVSASMDEMHEEMREERMQHRRGGRR
jgi:Spy/CpxP family protein refolding chaperone